MSDLRDSGLIEQDADHVLMVYRDSYCNDETETPDMADLRVRKNRHGPTGHIELRFDQEKMCFSSCI